MPVKVSFEMTDEDFQKLVIKAGMDFGFAPATVAEFAVGDFLKQPASTFRQVRAEGSPVLIICQKLESEEIQWKDVLDFVAAWDSFEMQKRMMEQWAEWNNEPVVKIEYDADLRGLQAQIDATLRGWGLEYTEGVRSLVYWVHEVKNCSQKLEG